MIKIPTGRARERLEAIPRMMRAEMCSRRRLDLFSLPQLRALICLGEGECASLSDLAEHLGLPLPSVCKRVAPLARAAGTGLAPGGRAGPQVRDAQGHDPGVRAPCPSFARPPWKT